MTGAPWDCVPVFLRHLYKTIMKTLPRIILLLSAAIAVSGCASQPQKPADPNKKLKLETIDHGPQRPKTYLFREVDR